MWTIEQIKKELPKVKVKFEDGTILTGEISGRKMDFPNVCVKRNGSWVCFEFSWWTLQNSLNRGKPVLV